MDPLHYETTYEYQPTAYYPTPYPYKESFQSDIQKTAELTESTVEVNRTVNVNFTLETNSDITKSESPVCEDIKPDIKKKKVKGRTSNFWNKKIFDKDFSFYGCSLCNIAYKTLKELDQHVVIHENRLTSYDVRKQNQKKRKKLKRLQKKLKKEKVKEEFDMEIKPEDGYIGTEKTVDVKERVDDVKVDNVEVDKNVNVYKCFGCNKIFALSYYLRIHVRSHTDEKPYTCSVCGQSFITASHLGRHNKRIHLAIRHQCRICYRFFNRFELLVKHFDRMHADDKLEGEPYDYNAILPYLKELEEQMTVDKSKPKTEDTWDQTTRIDNTDQHMMDVSKQEMKENVELPKQENDSEMIGSSTLYVPESTDYVEIKQEVDDHVENGPEVNALEVTETQVLGETNDKNDEATFEDDHFGDDDNFDDVKEEGASNSDSEYFPSDTWARPPGSPGGVCGGPVGNKCPVCNKTLSTKSYLRIHMRTHTGEKPFKCYICNRGFITASKMHRHVLTHDASWEDKQDGETDENESVKKKTKRIKGKSKVLGKSKKIKDKDGKSNKKWEYSCEYCHQRFFHQETLQIHRKCHEGEALSLRCQYCLEAAADDSLLKEHEASHSGPKPYLCNICGNSFKKKKNMLRHRQIHSDSDTLATKSRGRFRDEFICDICSKKFNSQTKLRRHIVSHSVSKFTLKYECPVCAHMFHTRYHVQMHLNTHMKEGLIQEENRNAVLAMVLQNARKIPKSTESLNVTDANIPDDDRSRICNICGEIFQHFYYLEEHLKTHGTKIAIEDIDKEEEKKYTCQVCSKSFKLHYYLKLHSFTHTKEKPFICQQCGKGFITKGKLKRHLETHQGLKKYQCHICCKFFTRPSYLRIHVRTIHGTQDYNFRDYGIGVPIANVNS